MALVSLATTLLDCVVESWCKILLLIVLLLVTWLYYSNPARHAAPGPMYIPLIGNIPFLFGTHIGGKYFMDLSQKYRSAIISVRVVGILITTLNDYDLIKEVFVRRIDVVDRNTNAAELMAALEKFERPTNGIGFASGPVWRHQRRFTTRLMRDFGMGKMSSEDNIHFEAAESIKAFKQYNGKPVDPEFIVMMAITNITAQFIFGHRFLYTDERFLNILRCISIFMVMFGEPTSFLFPTRLGRWLFKSKYERMRTAYLGLTNHVRQEIKEHEARYDGSVHDLIDAYLEEMATTKDLDEEICNQNMLTNMIRDLLLGGSETSSSVLRWALLEMAIHQDIQQKVYQEICSATPSGAVPTMSVKKDTPYTEAVFSECMRLHTLIEIGIPHSNNTDDLEINGYIIPKNTMINPNLYAVHHDPKVWKKPDEFYPGNFLDDEGKLINLDRLIQFSTGRRSCVCEALARVKLYIFFASWLKAFHIKLEKDDAVPDIEPTGNSIRMPKPFSLRFCPRT